MTLVDAALTGASGPTRPRGVDAWPAAVDWARHPLGEPETWPAGLRTAVEICLGSRFPMLVWWGPDLVMLYNHAYRPMLGAKHPDALGAPGREVWPEIWDVIGPMLDQVMTDGGATWSTDQMLVLDRNGFPEECYFTYSYSPIPDGSGGVGGVFCAVSETTDRVVGERRLATLAEMAHLLGVERRVDVVETAEALLAANPHDHPVSLVVDAVGVGETGPAVPDLAGRLDHLSDGTRDRVADLVRRARDTARAVRMPADPDALAAGVRSWHVHPVPASATGQPSRPAAVLVLGESVQRPWDPSLEAYATLCVTHLAAALTAVEDLSEERTRRRALVELDEAKSAFLTTVSHELRTPLTLIAGPVQELLGLVEDPQHRGRLELVQRSTARLVRMVDALLDFGRIEAGGLVAQPAPVDATELTRSLGESFRPVLERAGLSFTHECVELEEPVCVDVAMYERIVLNLLSNAVKYTPEGSVHLGLREADDHLVLSVRDTGVGIADADVERAFSRFERLSSWDGARSREGAGIGLAMVKQLTALMGGVVELASEVGVGSTFTVRLPTRDGSGGAVTDSAPSITPRRVDDFLREARLWEGDEDPLHTGPAGVRDTESTTSRPRVLVAEDNADLRRYLGQVLADLYDVELVDDGAAALDAALRDAPDLVLADVMMPTLDGHELVRRIREDRGLRGIPVVLLSARAGDDGASTGLGAGADDYLVKPFSVVELRARVASNLERAGARLQDTSWRRAVLDSLHDALVITDRDGTVLEVNERFTTMLGWTAEDGPFTPPYPWQPLEDGPGPSPADVQELATRDGGAEPVEGRLVSRDGRVLQVSARVTVVDGGRRRPDLLLWTLRDETHEHDERRRRSAAARLAADLGRAQELTDVLVAAVGGFSQLFAGAAAVRVVVGPHQHVFTPTGPLRPSALEEKVVAALGEADARATGDRRVPGVLLVAGAGAPECMVWVDFPEARRVSADEQITGDLLVEAFALACDRVVAATDFADRERHLRRAIDSHQEIGQAVGILVERHRWTTTAAFDRLKRASQDHNVKLRELARRVIESGADPADAGADLVSRP